MEGKLDISGSTGIFLHIEKFRNLYEKDKMVKRPVTTFYSLQVQDHSIFPCVAVGVKEGCVVQKFES